jgi:hypothetical protein
MCKRLSQALTNANLNGVHKNFEVSIIDGKNEFLGMCVYPDMQEYSNTVLATYNSKETSPYETFKSRWFNVIDTYYIELDKNLFDRNIINFTPQELTAMLLHELSHVVYSDKTTEKLYKAYQVHKTHLKNHESGLTKVALSTLYIVPGMIACTAHKANTGRNGMKEEYICDKVFGLKNYQEHLVDALNKIIKAYGTKLVIDDGLSDKQIDASMKWVDFNVDNIISRRDALGREVINMASNTRSRYAKNAFLDITKKLGIGARDKYTHDLIAMESVFDGLYDGTISFNGFSTKYDLYDIPKAVGALETAVKCAETSIAMESAAKKNYKPKLPSGLEIDSIMVEIDRVRTHSDRIYVLDLIHSRLEQISEFEEFYGVTSDVYSRYKPTIDRYRKQLDEMRTLVLAKHNLDKSYKVFIKSPVGYEG